MNYKTRKELYLSSAMVGICFGISVGIGALCLRQKENYQPRAMIIDRYFEGDLEKIIVLKQGSNKVCSAETPLFSPGAYSCLNLGFYDSKRNRQGIFHIDTNKNEEISSWIKNNLKGKDLEVYVQAGDGDSDANFKRTIEILDKYHLIPNTIIATSTKTDEDQHKIFIPERIRGEGVMVNFDDGEEMLLHLGKMYKLKRENKEIERTDAFLKKLNEFIIDKKY